MTDSPVIFDIKTPLNNTIVKNQIKKSMSRGLLEFDSNPYKEINIVANGPSARGVFLDGPVLALNGAINLFPKEHPPEFWAACDPQALVAEFLKNPSHSTQYLVASKCHPKVFDRLRGYDVKLWHINDQEIPSVRRVPCAVSITLCTIMLMQRMGYRKINIFGWDCCFGAGGEHHGAETHAPPTIDTVTVEVGGYSFKTTASWAAEAQDAVNIIPVMEWCGVEINIQGDGMISHIRREMNKAA